MYIRLQSWTRVGLFGSGSGRDFQIISGFFWADMQHVNTKYFSSIFLCFCCIFPHVPHEIYKFSTDCLLVTFTFMKQHRITCRPRAGGRAST